MRAISMDRERYNRLRELAAEIMSEYTKVVLQRLAGGCVVVAIGDGDATQRKAPLLQCGSLAVIICQVSRE
jgi:hypothetical protein